MIRKRGVSHNPLTGVKYIIGVDLSLRGTGISVHDNTGRMITTFLLSTTAGTSDHKSCDEIVDKFFDMLAPYLTEELCRQKATVFFFEDFYYTTGGKAGSGKLAGRLQVFGVLTWLIRLSGLYAWAVTPAALTSFLLGTVPRKSADKKKAVMDWLHVNRNFYTKNDNLADAYSAAEFGYAYLVEGKRLSVRALFVR